MSNLGGFNIGRFKKGPGSSGFTLFEILMVASLISLIGLALYQALSNGIRIWERSQELLIEEDIAIFFDKISFDLRNSFNYSQLSFKGSENKIEFPAIVQTLQDRGRIWGEPNYTKQIGKVEYAFDTVESGIFRRQANYSEAIRDKYGKGRVLAGPVSNLTFRYYYVDGEDVTSKPRAGGKLPDAVEIFVEYSDSLKKEREMSRLVYLALWVK